MARRGRWLPIAIVLVARTLALAEPGEETLRCGGRLVRAGVTMSDVVSACGPPTERGETQRVLTFVQVNEFQWAPVVTEFEAWVYDRGPSQFMRVLTFKNGELDSIRLGGYGIGVR